MMKLIDSVKVKNTLGEGVVWHEVSQSVWWTDIEEKTLFKYKLCGKKLTMFSTPYRLCAFGFTQQENVILAAFDCGIALFNIETKDTKWLFKLEEDSPLRFNDGRMDAQGRFWVGTMNENHPKDLDASLYFVDSDLQVRKVATGFGIVNGIAWNIDATKFYLADSFQQCVFQYDFCQASGELSGQSSFVYTANHEFPDGAVVDEDDHYWSALWGGSSLVRYSTNGSEQSFKVPVSQPTCVVFGGKNHSLLFVTTATYGLSDEQISKQPLAGALLIFDTQFSGNQNHVFSSLEGLNV